MGLQQSRQALTSKPPAQEAQQQPEPCFDGFVPRSAVARQACNLRRVRKLVRAHRLARCWEADLEVEGEECPVCMEHYRRLNSTACCHQDICNECFICVVAPGGVSSRCPYCQAPALQVYLRPLPSSPAESEPEAAAEAADSACEAAADSDAPPAAADPSARPASRMGVSSGGSSSTARAASTASSGLSMVSLDLDGEAGVPFTAFLAPAPAAAARAAVRQHQEALRSGCSSDAADGSCGSSLVPVALSMGCDLRLLAEAVAEASRAQGPAIVAVVRRADQPGSRGEGEPSSSSSGAAPGGSGAAPGGSGSSSGGSPPPSAGSEQLMMPASQPAAAAAPPSVPAEGGPAVLQLPDGSEQLVLLRTAAQVAEEEAAAAAATRRREQAAAVEAAAAATYQPPATVEDERMRRAIAQADAALLQHQPAAPGPQPGEDWLERMRQSDAALQAAVARRDAERFASGSGGTDAGGGAGGSSH